MRKLFSRFTIITILIVMMVAVSVTPTVSAVTTASLNNGPNKGRYAVLTYDDCPYAPWVGVGKRNTTPNGRTPQAALDNYKQTINELVRLRAAVVIAPTGFCINQYKRHFNINIAQYARYRGQYVMSHTYDHRHLSQLSKKAIRNQVKKAPPSYWVRPPYGDVNPKVHKVLKSMKRKAWNWTVSSSDYRGYSQQTVVNSMVLKCRTGDTCLLHLNTSGFSPEALRQTVQGMRSQGTRVCGLRMKSNGQPVATTVRWRTLACRG